MIEGLDQHFSERLRALKENDNKLKWRCVELEGVRKYMRVRLANIGLRELLLQYEFWEEMLKKSRNGSVEIPCEADGSYITSQGKSSHAKVTQHLW